MTKPTTINSDNYGVVITTNPKTWQYSVSLNGEYHQVVLTQFRDIDPCDGTFYTCGSYGSYAFYWSNTGYEDFRGFIAKISTDYFYNKITHKHAIYDGVATHKAVDKFLEEHYAEIPNAYSDEMFCIDDEYNALQDESDFTNWATNTDIDVCAEDLMKYKAEPQCNAFCTKLFPLLQQRLREEVALGIAKKGVGQ